ncbi:MAG: hypothetical protein ACKN9V_02160 [Pseudomonadota bacterium]
MKGPRIHFQLGVLFGALVLVALETILEVHVSGTDVFLFKEAGINLATKGKFVASFLPHMMFGEERPFAYYPPLYPFIFGIWSWIVGVGLKQSLFFDSLLTIGRTLLMLRLVVPTLPESFFSKKQWAIRWGAGLLFCLLSLVSTDQDRPDELALIWGLLLCFSLNSEKPLRLKIPLSAMFLAFVGATSPACGVLFAIVVGVWSLTQTRSISCLLGIGIGSLFFWGLTVMPVLLHDMTSGIRFSKQAGISSFPYLRYLPNSWTLNDLLRAWGSDLNRFLGSGKSYLFVSLGTLSLAPFLLLHYRSPRLEMRQVLLIAAIIYTLIVPLVWTLQPYYLWFGSIVLMTGIFQYQNKLKLKMQALLLVSSFVFLTPLFFWESKCVLNALEVPKSEQLEEIRKAVLAEIEPQARMAVTHDQYFTFRPLKEVVNVDYWMHEANRLDYLYITDLPDSRRQVPRKRQLLSEKDQPCFELVKDFSTYTPIHVLGYKTKYFVRGNGGSLFRNICKQS